MDSAFGEYTGINQKSVSLTIATALAIVVALGTCGPAITNLANPAVKGDGSAISDDRSVIRDAQIDSISVSDL